MEMNIFSSPWSTPTKLLKNSWKIQSENNNLKTLLYCAYSYWRQQNKWLYILWQLGTETCSGWKAEQAFPHFKKCCHQSQYMWSANIDLVDSECSHALLGGGNFWNSLMDWFWWTCLPTRHRLQRPRLAASRGRSESSQEVYCNLQHTHPLQD